MSKYKCQTAIQKAMQRVIDGKHKGMVLSKGSLLSWGDTLSSSSNSHSPIPDNSYLIVQLEHDMGKIIVYDDGCSNIKDVGSVKIDKNIEVGDHIELIIISNTEAMWKRDRDYYNGNFSGTFYDHNITEKQKENSFYFVHRRNKGAIANNSPVSPADKSDNVEKMNKIDEIVDSVRYVVEPTVEEDKDKGNWVILDTEMNIGVAFFIDKEMAYITADFMHKKYINKKIGELK